MERLFLDATGGLAEVFRAMRRDGDPAIDTTIQAQVALDDRPAMLQGYGFILDVHTALPRWATPLNYRIASGERAGERPLGGSGVACAKIATCVGVAEW